MKSFEHDPLTLGIIGAGAMGRGIAQVAAQAGLTVKLFDLDSKVAGEAVVFVDQMLDRAQVKGRLSAAEAANAKQCLQTVETLPELADADLVLEAVVERIDVKQNLFRQLEALVSPHCVLATNTSSLSVTEIATAVERPERVAGYHFFNPVPLMKLAEVIGGMRTAEPVLDQLVALTRRIGHEPVRVIDSPGFLVNHCGRGLVTEGMRVLQEAVAEPAVLDAIMRECAGFRMGPCELMDLTGLDITFPASEQIYSGYFQEPRLRPAPLMRVRLNAGLLGRKTGEGFYRYVNGEQQVPQQALPRAAEVTAPLWVSPQHPALCEKLISLLQMAGVRLDEGERPGKDSIVLVTPLGSDATSVAVSAGVDPARTLAVDALFTTVRRVTVMTNPATTKESLAQVVAAFEQAGRVVSVIRDSTGFVAQRIVATIINIACEIAQQRIAVPVDIDTAARLALGYPQGPLELGDALGADTVLNILENIYQVNGDDRYRPSVWLRRRAQLQLPLTFTEAF
uniref:3-hydroxyacyl-CoA dehydrogenase n=1 Tax=Marinobacterium profundum TaxID=1714300 RepID=UPI00082A4E19|nr:3-hydroxyacyl-CoA dehydrogenase [Marinobacterium profundum]